MNGITLKKNARPGFALIAVISLVTLLALVAIALLSIGTVNTRSASAKEVEQAKENSRLALSVALEQLQKSAGSDQRITATADILGNAVEGKAHWTGVWDTTNYSNTDPDTKPFLSWLVSTDPANAGQEAEVTNASSANSFTIFNGSAPADSVVVSKIGVTDGSGQQGSYAYWVEDQGVKADLGWSESGTSNTDLKQALRLSAAPGVDYGVFNGPFNSISYPLERGSGNDFLDDIDKAINLATVPLAAKATTSQQDWLRQNRHDIAIGNLGVISDTKSGGLRRDLSLAFEMDGEADIDFSEQPTRFNKQEGEFVGGTDKLGAVNQIPGMNGVKERHLFRDTPTSGGDFSSSIIRSQAVMRGPTWWALRDYYNLYKRLKDDGSGGFSMPARAYYPNRDEAGASIGDMLDTVNTWGDYWDLDLRTPRDGPLEEIETYIHRPATSNYAPVNLGMTTLLSLTTVPSRRTPGMLDMAVVLDPIFYLWNPYNRSIEFESVAVYLETGLPGEIVYHYGTERKTVEIARLLRDNLDNANRSQRVNGFSFSFFIGDPSGSITLAPGEVVAATPLPAVTGESALGFDALDNNSGIVCTLVRNQPVTVDPSAALNVGYVNVNSTNSRFFIETNLPPSGATAENLVSQRNPIGDQTQVLHMQVDQVRQESVQEDVDIFSSTKTASSLLGRKQQFGIITHLVKPSQWQGSAPNPVEVFSRFNPAPMVVHKDFWAAASPNQVFSVAVSESPNDLITNQGINFSATSRNAFWGRSYDSQGSTSVPMSNIPSQPLYSLADFAHANISIMGSDPFHAIGNSWSNAVSASPLSPYGRVTTGGGVDKEDFTTSDLSWHCNDALFDRYFLSGIAPEFTIGVGGYNAGGTIEARLTEFYGDDHTEAEASPVMLPYVPAGKKIEEIIEELDPENADDSYKKIGAYSLIKGSFNVNSTSVEAWSALLRANKGIDVEYSEGGATNSGANETPFPSSVSPSEPGNGAKPGWAGLSRLSDTEIDTLAQEIVNQVKLRGPFMSLANFVNRKVGGTTVTDEYYTGALQTAIEDSGINAAARTAAGGGDATFYDQTIFVQDISSATSSALNTATGIPTDITQADLLRPLAPRLSARTDSFRIRAYGEVLDNNGNVVSTAMCEALVQRIPDYVDDTNKPWDDGDAQTSDQPLTPVNEEFGRRFKIKSFRWLDPSEI